MLNQFQYNFVLETQGAHQAKHACVEMVDGQATEGVLQATVDVRQAKRDAWVEMADVRQANCDAWEATEGERQAMEAVRQARRDA